MEIWGFDVDSRWFVPSATTRRRIPSCKISFDSCDLGLSSAENRVLMRAVFVKIRTHHFVTNPPVIILHSSSPKTMQFYQKLDTPLAITGANANTLFNVIGWGSILLKLIHNGHVTPIRIHDVYHALACSRNLLSVQQLVLQSIVPDFSKLGECSLRLNGEIIGHATQSSGLYVRATPASVLTSSDDWQEGIKSR